MYTTLEEGGMSAHMRKKVGTTLTMALGDAVKMGLLGNNPAEAIRKPKVDKAEINPLDPEQVRALLKATEADRLAALYVLAIDSGMRQGELFGLLWDVVDFEAGAVSVTRSLEEKSGQHRLKDVKTASSRRRIRLAPSTMAALNVHRAKMLAEGHYRPEGPVFCDRDGGWLRKSNFTRRVFQPTVKRAGLSNVRFHDLRHTAATLLLLGSINVKAVSQRLGHGSVVITLDIYSHVLPQKGPEVIGVTTPLIVTKRTPATRKGLR